MPRTVFVIPQPFCRRRFPFKPKHTSEQVAINSMANEVIKGVENMIFLQVRSRRSVNLQEDDIQEIAHKCMISLWDTSLPCYDLRRRPSVKISTFIHQCVRNFVSQEIRSIHRQRNSSRRILGLDQSLMAQTLVAPDTSLDDKIEALAQDIIANPEKYLTTTQANVLRKLLAKDQSRRNLAKSLGYKRPGSLSTLLARLRERILTFEVTHD